jgi:hypothetical protein
MRKITLLIFLIVLLSVAFCHQRFQQPDPIAREIADIIDHTENCNVIIASDEQLDHLEPTDYVPVTIYSHSRCLADKKYCVKERKLPERAVHCNRVILTTKQQTEPTPASEPKEELTTLTDPTRPSFLSEVSKLARIQTTDTTTPYFWIKEEHGSEDTFTHFATTDETKTQLINMYAVQVRKTEIAKYYFLCQFCDKHCEHVIPLLVPRQQVYEDVIRDGKLHPNAVDRRSWSIMDSYDDWFGDRRSQSHTRYSDVDLTNPFRIRAGLVPSYLRFYVVKVLIESTNSTLRGSSQCRVGEILLRESGKGRSNGSMNHKKHTLIWSGSDTFSFVTCHVKQKWIQFDTYIDPFDAGIWLGLVLSPLITMGITVYYLHFRNMQAVDRFQLLMIMYCPLLNLCYWIPNPLSKAFWYRIILVAWLLAAIVLSNCYTGTAISGVISPLPANSITRFDELTSTRLCNPPEIPCKWHTVDAKLSEWDSEPVDGLFQTYSTPINDDMSRAFEWESTRFGSQLNEEFYKNLWNYYEKQGMKLTKFQIAMMPLVSRSSKMFVPGPIPNFKTDETDLVDHLSRIEYEIIQGQGKVYVDPTEYAMEEFRYLKEHYKWKNFRVSSEKIFWHQRFLAVGAELGSPIPQKYRQLQAAGIEQYMNKQFRSRLYQKRIQNTRKIVSESDRPESEEPVRLSGSIQTVFYIYCALTALSICIFVCEVAGPLICRYIAFLYDKWITQGYLIYVLWLLFLETFRISNVIWTFCSKQCARLVNGLKR